MRFMNGKIRGQMAFLGQIFDCCYSKDFIDVAIRIQWDKKIG